MLTIIYCMNREGKKGRKKGRKEEGGRGKEHCIVGRTDLKKRGAGSVR